MKLVLATLALILLFASFQAGLAEPEPSIVPPPAGVVRSDGNPAAASGFAANDETLFAPVVQLAAPGSDRAARAITIFDRQIEFQRRIAFHPEWDESLNKIVEQLPPRQSTLIRAASLYSRDDIAWNILPEGVRQISVSGAPAGASYRYRLTKKYTSPEVPTHMSGAFTLKPSPESVAHGGRAVDAALGGEILMDTYGAGAAVDFGSSALRQVRADLQAPWDTVPGEFNHHDRAALARLHEQMPTFAERIDHYLELHNFLDEFDTPKGAVVLFNLDAEVKRDALKHLPHLNEFYNSVAPIVDAESAIIDRAGNFWMRTQFKNGHIRVAFMVRGGQLTPFDSSYKPAGESLDLPTVARGVYRTHASVKVHRLGMTVGLDNLDFQTEFRRDPNSVTFTNSMQSVPTLVAPPGIHKVADMIAGDFLRVLAQGDGGFKAKLSSRRGDDGLFHYAAGITAEFNYSPTLEFLARIGDSIAEKHNAEVRAEERKFGQELFDAIVTDYNSARPRILALDSVHEDRRADSAASR